MLVACRLAGLSALELIMQRQRAAANLRTACGCGLTWSPRSDNCEKAEDWQAIASLPPPPPLIWPAPALAMTPTRILGVVRCHSAPAESTGRCPLPVSSRVCGPNKPHLTTPARYTARARGQQRSVGFPGLPDWPNSKEMLHMFKKCVSIWDAREAGTKKQ
jgi:hypothetical protein